MGNLIEKLNNIETIKSKKYKEAIRPVLVFFIILFGWIIFENKLIYLFDEFILPLLRRG